MSANYFCRGLDNKYFRLCEPYCFYHNRNLVDEHSWLYSSSFFYFFFKQKQEVGQDFSSGTQFATLDLGTRTKILPVM